MDDHFLRLTLSVARLNKLIQRCKNLGMNELDLKASHTLVLYQLADHPEGLRFAALSACCDLDRALISRVLAELTGGGLVEKQGAPGRYNALYTLTPAGKDCMEQIRRVVQVMQRRADEGLRPEELDTFYRVLDTLTERLQQMENDPDLFAPLRR